MSCWIVSWYAVIGWSVLPDMLQANFWERTEERVVDFALLWCDVDGLVRLDLRQHNVFFVDVCTSWTVRKRRIFWRFSHSRVFSTISCFTENIFSPPKKSYFYTPLAFTRFQDLCVWGVDGIFEFSKDVLFALVVVGPFWDATKTLTVITIFEFAWRIWGPVCISFCACDDVGWLCWCVDDRVACWYVHDNYVDVLMIVLIIPNRQCNELVRNDTVLKQSYAQMRTYSSRERSNLSII
jgi:hypothetical protein